MSERLFSKQTELLDLLIRDVHVLDPRESIDTRQDVLVIAGEIAEIAPAGACQAPEGIPVLDASSLHAFPAFVDPHIHLRVPGQEHKEDISTGTRAAAAGGYCAVVAMPNTTPTVDSAATVAALRGLASREAVIPTGFTASITRGLDGAELTDMVELREEGVVGFTDDGKPVRDAGMLRRALQYQRLSGGIIALHEEDPSLSAGGSMHEGDVSARLGITGIPSISETTMIVRDIAIAEYEDAHIHLQHLSAAESVEAVAAAKERGVRVTAEASPHHLTLTHEDVRSLDTSFKMNPPLRSDRDREAIIGGLKSGVIECVATDHAPHALPEKEVPFEQAMMGTTGLESSFAVLNTDLVLPGVIDLATLVERMTSGAAICELPTPLIAIGERANICLVDLAENWQIGAEGYASKSSNCCFDGMAVSGRVKLTVADGQVAFGSNLIGVQK